MTRRGLIITVTVLALLTTGYLAVAHTYPLVYGDRGSAPGRRVIDGEPVTVSLTVRNTGSISVSFTGVRLAGADATVELVRMIEKAGDGPGCCTFDHTVAFRPVTLVPASQVMLFLTMRVTDPESYAPCTGFELEQVLVSYQVLYVAREEPIALPGPISFQKPC